MSTWVIILFMTAVTHGGVAISTPPSMHFSSKADCTAAGNEWVASSIPYYHAGFSCLEIK